MNTQGSVSRHDLATDSRYKLSDFDTESNPEKEKSVHQKDAPSPPSKHEDGGVLHASPLASPMSNQSAGVMCSPKIPEAVNSSGARADVESSKCEKPHFIVDDPASETPGMSGVPAYSEIALQIEKERTRQTELKCELARLVTEIIKTSEKTGVTSELLGKMFLAEEPTDYKQYLHYMKAQMQSAGGPAPGGVKPETPSPRSPAMPSSATYGTLTSISGVNSAMGSQASHSRSSSGRSLHPPPCSSIDERVKPTESATGCVIACTPQKTPDSSSYDRPMPLYTQQAFPAYYMHADHSTYSGPPGTAPQQMHSNVQPVAVAAGSNPAIPNTARVAKSDESLGSPYNTQKQHSAFQSSPLFRTSTQASPGSSAAHSPQSQVSGLQPHPVQAQGKPMVTHAQTSQVQMFQNAPMPPHALPTAVMSAATAGAHAQPQPVYYMNASQQVSAPMVPSSYYMPNNMVPWKFLPMPAEKRREEEEPHVTKKSKTGKNSLNFMISTPKNPPARKYNK